MPDRLFGFPHPVVDLRQVNLDIVPAGVGMENFLQLFFRLVVFCGGDIGFAQLIPGILVVLVLFQRISEQDDGTVGVPFLDFLDPLRVEIFLALAATTCNARHDEKKQYEISQHVIHPPELFYM